VRFCSGTGLEQLCGTLRLALSVDAGKYIRASCIKWRQGQAMIGKDKASKPVRSMDCRRLKSFTADSGCMVHPETRNIAKSRGNALQAALLLMLLLTLKREGAGACWNGS
jgi:hypothetical protein